MKRRKIWNRAVATTVCMVMALGCAACSCSGDEEGSGKVNSDIVNGDFEQIGENSKWIGWTRDDAAFSARGIVDKTTLNGVDMAKSGTYFFSGSDAGNQAMRGTLTSEVFKLSGTGHIVFKMGAGKNTDKVYVEFFEEGNDSKPLATVKNTDCDGIYITDHLITKVVDLTKYVGKNIYIKVTDNDDGNDLSYVNLDGFKMCTTEDEVKKAEEEYKKQIEEFGAKPFTEDETSATIQNGNFETGDLSGWVILEGTAFGRANLVSTSQFYWSDRLVYGEGEYYLDGSNNGAILETATGSMRSSKFTLAGDGYISFMIGAGRENCYVAVCDGNTDEELIVVKNEAFADPALALTLVRVYVDASEYMGKVLYLKVVDANDAGGFGFINVDDFRVSMTKDEVSALEVEQLEKIKKETYTSASYNDLATLLNYYNNYDYPMPLQALTFTQYAKSQVIDCSDSVDLSTLIADAKLVKGDTEIKDLTVTKVTFDGKEYTEGFSAFNMSAAGAYTVTYGASGAEATVTIIARDASDVNQVVNGGFETGDLAGWTVLTDGWSVVEGKEQGVINAANYWGEELPYNQSGNFHLDGWNTGIEEIGTWEIKSTNFTLEGSGFISVKMGGNAAAVKVFLADGTQIGYYKQNRFSDTNFPHVGQGGSWADMGTYVMDLSAYKGKDMYIVLCDEAAEGWAQAFFDDVVTYYESAPDYANTSDAVYDGHTAEETPAEINIPWQLAENLK